jgi:hypothetical protein
MGDAPIFDIFRKGTRSLSHVQFYRYQSTRRVLEGHKSHVCVPLEDACPVAIRQIQDLGSVTI